jgi:hypothetical protein
VLEGIEGCFTLSGGVLERSRGVVVGGKVGGRDGFGAGGGRVDYTFFFLLFCCRYCMEVRLCWISCFQNQSCRLQDLVEENVAISYVKL